VLVCFTPGRYELRRPLVLGSRHSNVTLRSCNESAVLTVREGSEEEFGHGMVILVDADNVTLSGLEFEMPQIAAVLARVNGATGGMLDREAVRGINADQANRWVSIGVRAINCAVLAVRDCLFRFTVGERQTEREDAQTMPRNVFGVGVFAAGGAWGFELTDNRFLHDPTTPLVDGGPFHLLAGYLLTQTALSRSQTGVSLGASTLPGILDDALISGNEFRGLTVAVLVAADVGDVRAWDNVVRDCYAGLILLDADALVRAEPNAAGTVGGLTRAAAATGDSAVLRILVLAMVYPLPSFATTPARGIVSASGAVLTRLRQASLARESVISERFAARIAAEQPDAPDVDVRHAAPPQLLAAWRGLAGLNRLDASPSGRRRGDHQPGTALSIQRNTIDCMTPDDGETGFALMLSAAPAELGGASAMVTGNRISSPNTVIVAVVSGMGSASVTGNVVVSGRGEQRIALAVLSTNAAAATGNVIVGVAVLPPRPTVPAPLDSWLPFNEIIF